MKEEGKKPKDTAILKTDSDRAAFQAFMAFKGTLAQTHLAAFTKYAALALQGAFLLNGSVGFAAFAQRSESVCSLVLCAVGAVSALVSAGSAYIAQRHFLSLDLMEHARLERHYFLLSPIPEAETCSLQKRCRRWLIATVFLFLLSLSLFGLGLYNMLRTAP